MWRDDPPADEPADALRILATLAARWRGAATLAYRSHAVLKHAGELTVTVKSQVQLRRPNLARILFDADQPDISALRVCNGVRVFHRPKGTLLRPAQTLTYPLRGDVTTGIAHPLDEVGYSIDQFFSPRPFWPPAREVDAQAVRRKEKDGTIFELTLRSGVRVDTLTLDARTYAPRRLIRVGDHAGMVQELLREEFSEVALAAALPAPLFTWTPEDEARS